MIKYATIRDNQVINIICAEDNFDISQINGTHIQISDSTGDAQIGSIYNVEKQKFIPVAVWKSWTFNEDSWQWEAPVAKPSTGNWQWNEGSQEWVELVSGIVE